MLTLHPATDYAQERYDLLVQLELFRLDPYVDSRDIPTIGIGFNLQDLFVRSAVFQAFGINTANPAEAPYVGALNAYLNGTYPLSQQTALRDALDLVMFERSQALGGGRATFSFANETEVQIVLATVVAAKEDLVDLWLERTGLASTLQGMSSRNTRERIALVSLAYNSKVYGKDRSDTAWNDEGLPTTLGPKLTRALLADDRAEAWFEIRYNTNPPGTSDRPGIANRRYKESDLFNLYEQGDLTLEGAQGADRMFTRHSATIPSYEERFDPTNGASTHIDDQLDKAKSFLTKAFVEDKGIAIDIGVRDIPVGEDQTTLYFRNTDADPLEGGGDNDLIFGESGNDVLIGKGGDDVLYGGDGIDTLDPGTGKAFLFGGKGADVYRITSLTDTLTIEDEDGKGLIVFDPDGEVTGLVGGTREAGAGGAYKIPDPEHPYQVSYSWSGSGADLTIKIDGQPGKILVKDFNLGDLNINLIELSPLPPEDLSSLPHPQNGTKFNDRADTPDYEDLDGDGENDIGPIFGNDAAQLIEGFAGDDDIFGKGGGDRLIGGPDNDIIDADGDRQSKRARGRQHHRKAENKSVPVLSAVLSGGEGQSAEFSKNLDRDVWRAAR
ncbi:MAG: hypothetical protein BMS9Abin05_2396 [Rhodothermia bacterium]|nr:MAG: hypothetical protein BMS9Abin05_2396 [Rhodothermia bacterium]